MSSKQGNPSFSRGGARGRGGRATVRGRGGRGGRGGRSAGVPADYSNAVFDYDTPAAAAAAAAALATAVSAPASSDEAPKMSYSSQSSSRNITRNSSPFQFRPRQAPVPERCKAAALEDSTCGGPVASNSGNSSSIRTTSSDHHGLSTALLEPFVGQPVAEIAGSQHASSGRHQGIGMFRGNMMRSAAKFQSSSLSSSSSSSFQRGRSDGSLLRPVAFVKASTSLASTMTQNQDTAPNRSNAGSEAITTWNSPSYSASSTTAATNAATDVVAAPSLEDRAPNMQTSRQSTPHGQKSPDPACEVPSGTSDHLIEAELPARHSPSSPPLFTIDVTGYPLEAPPSRVAAPDAESLNTSMGSTSGVVSDLSDTEEVYAPSKIAVRRISQPPSSQSALRHPRHDASHEDSLSPFARERCSVRILEDVYCMPQTARRGQNITKVPHPVQQRDENLLQAEATIEHAPFEDTVTLDSEMSTLTAGLGIDHNIRPELSPSPTPPSFSTSPRAHQLHNSYPDEPFSAALEDYVSNVQVNTQTDQSTDSENDETLDLAFAKSFLRASTSEHLNSNDLADIAVLKKERTTARRRLQRESIRLGGNGSSQAGRRWPLRRSEEETSGLSSSGNEDLSGASSSEEDFEVADDVSSQSDPVIDLAYSPAFRVGKGSRLIEAELALDELDEHLQRQWEKDRAKKAIKRQERYLKLLEAHPTKANRKKAKRSGLTSDTYFFNASHDVSERPVFHRINEEIKIFIEDSNRNELHLPPMEKQKRYAIHMLAEAYNLKSKSRGSGEARFNVLYRTARSTLANANVKKIQRYLSMSASWPDRSGQSTRNAERSGGPNRHTHALRNNEGAVVGEGADRISADNIGHQLLAKMGWTIGQQIGRGAGGLDEPLSAIVKTSKAGLGSGYVRYNRGEASS